MGFKKLIDLDLLDRFLTGIKALIPAKTSDLANDSGFITSETDPTVPSWAKQSSKPTYTASEVGLGNVDNVQQYSASNPPPYPVTSVNGSTGAITIPTLPSVSSSDNDKVLKVVSGAWAAATDDGGATMVVTVTESNGDYTADKTFSEISTAAADGYVILVKTNGAYYPLTAINYRYAEFRKAVVTFSEYASPHLSTGGFYIYNNDVIYSDFNSADVPPLTIKFISIDNVGSETYEVLDFNTDFDEMLEEWTNNTMNNLAFVLRYWKSTRDQTTDPPTDGEVEEYHLSNAYTESEYDSELGSWVTNYHVQFVNIVDTSNGPVCKVFKLVGNNDFSPYNAEITYSEYIVGGSITETDPTVPAWAKQSSKPTYTASEVGALPDSTVIPSKTSDLANDSGFITGMTILSYGSSTWDDFLTAYNANKVVYCRASSNSNPATGNQTRMAFMAYVNANPPTNVEFQYYRSVNSHSATQQGDQVYVYKLDKTAGWTVTVRENYTKIAAGTGLSSSYSSGTLTLSNSQVVPTKTSDLTNDSGFITGYTETDPTVPSWAKASSKPTYTASEVGLGNVDNVQQYSATNPPPYPVTSVNGSTGAVTVRELPSVSSSDNDKVLKVVSGAWAAATDDGVPTMIANITYSSGTYTSDKTYAQLKAVLDAGGIAYAYNSPNFYEVQQYDSSRIIFKRTYVDMSNYLVRDECWYIYSSNLVSSGYANAYTQFRKYIYLVCDDDYSYQDSPSGTFSIDTNGQIDDIMTLFRSATSDGGDSQVIIDLIYGNPDAETDGSACEVYHPSKAYIDIENGDSICTIVYRTLSSRNGLPVVKNVVIRAPIYSYEFLEDATVTYSEVVDSSSDIILVQNAQPQSSNNKIWIKETSTSVSIPEMSDIADFVSFTEDQTSRTDAEKAQARSNIGAELVTAWTSYQYVYTLNSQQGTMTIRRKGRLRIANFDSNIKPASANTQYTLFSLNDIDKPSDIVRFASNTKVNSAMKGYGFYQIDSDGTVSYISTYAGNQEGRATGVYLAAEAAE